MSEAAINEVRTLRAANQRMASEQGRLRGEVEVLQLAQEEALAAAEEIETLHEEQQATNEELETVNEELQATIEELQATVRGALRVCRKGGIVHVVDAILPETGSQLFKRVWFGLDAGRFPRTRDHLRAALAAHGAIMEEELLPGPLHDCVYFGIGAR